MTPDRPSEDGFALRGAEVGDAAALGRLHVASWRETYVDVLPAEMLAAQSVQARTRLWARVIDDEATSVLVAAREGVIVGFASCGAQQDGSLAHDGFQSEVSAIYVLRAEQGIGIGTALMHAAAIDLSNQAYTGVALWVLRDNSPARGFYESLGGVLAGTKDDVRGDAVLTEVAYGWRDLAALSAACGARRCRTRSPSTAR